ncbi:MAG: tryptophan-rich sensory protein [Patescibacteria group bacterium]
MTINQIPILLLTLVLSFGLPALLGASYNYYTAQWYKDLVRPSFAFPDIVFIVIFPIFYILETIGLYTLITNSNQTDLFVYAILFLASSILNGIWSRLFFIYKRCDWSLVAFFAGFPFDWLFLFLLTKENHYAFIFFVPRVIWGLYAIFANVQYYRLNKQFWDDQALPNQL